MVPRSCWVALGGMLCHASGSVPACGCAGVQVCWRGWSVSLSVSQFVSLSVCLSVYLVGVHSLSGCVDRQDGRTDGRKDVLRMAVGSQAWTPTFLQLPLSEDGNMQARIPPGSRENHLDALADVLAACCAA